MTIRKPPGKRLTSLLLSLALLLTLVPAMGTTAAAANAAPSAAQVGVDGNKFFEKGTEAYLDRLYYKNGDEAYRFSGSASDYNAHYNPDTGVLTLNNYEGGDISIAASGLNPAKDIIIELIGDNTVTGSIDNKTNGALTITGSGSLTVTDVSNSRAVRGITSGFSATETVGSVTIKDKARVTINAIYTGTEAKTAYGIYARKSITISENASVNITCKTPETTSGNASCYGMFVFEGGISNLTINTTGNIHVNVSNAGSGAYSYGLYAPSYTLTKVGSMVVQWKKQSLTDYGAPFLRDESFSTTTHAVNVDTSSCYASYRYGTPYTVTVSHGYIKAGSPGLKYNTQRGAFLKGDKLTLFAPDRQASSTDTTKIPFDKWVSDDVNITSENSQTVSFAMPSKDVAVRANYNPFTTDGQPKFTRTSGTEGTISFTLVSGKFDDMGRPKIYPVGSSTSLGYFYTGSATQKTFTVYKNDCPDGQYVVGVSYNGVMCYSEPFRVKYTKPSASVAEEVTVEGKAGEAVNGTVTITLKDDKFADPLPSNGKWIQNLPDDLTEEVTRTGETTATITITGTPKVGCTEEMEITIPAGALVEESGTPVKVSIDGRARFAITSNAPTADKIVIGGTKFPNGNLYYKNGGIFSNDSSNWNAHYDPQTGTLTLKNYNGPYIRINGDHGQTVTIKLVGNDSTVKSGSDAAIELMDGVNLVITSSEAASLTLDATNVRGIGPARQANNTGSVTISGSANVTINASSYMTAYGICSGKDVEVRDDASLKITCHSDGDAKIGYGIFTPSGKVTVDTTGTVDIDVSECANSNTCCIYANNIAFKNAKTITLKYVPKSAGWNPSEPTYGTLDASGMKSPTTAPTDKDGKKIVGEVTTVTYAKKGAPPAAPTISAYSFEFYQNQTVTLACATSGTTIYYTTDGSDPTTSSTKTQYTEPFFVRNSCTVKAVAYSAEDEQYSAVTEAVFTRKPVSITVVGGGKAYSDPERTIEITQAEPGTTVYLKAPAETDDGTKVFSDWSSTVKITNKESCDSAYFVMPATQPTIKASYKTKPAGVTVSGTAVSWNNKDNAEYYLYPTTMSDADIRAQWKTGGTVGGYSYTGTKGGITQNTDGKRYDQTFSFSTVPTGTYKLVIFKPDKYVPKIVEITVESTALDLGQLKLWLYGDATGDGKIRTGDATQIYKYLADERTFTDDEFAAADVTGDGKIRTGDATQIYKYLASESSKFDEYK